MSNKYKYMTT